MKKIIILILAIVLAACGAPAPTDQAVAPEPVVVTVVVEPTQAPATAVPAEPVVVTVVVEATQVPATNIPPTEIPPTEALPTEVPATDSTGTIALDNSLGKGVFTNMTMSGSTLTLRCAPRDITFNLSTLNNSIVDVLLYYRIVDLDRTYAGTAEWKNFGEMTATGNGNFSVTFKGEDVHPNVRIDGSWLDFQFIGLAKSGDVVDRSQRIESMVKYTFDCP